MLLVDRAGRKILISTSAFGISIGMFVFAAYSYLNSLGYDLTSLNWIPLASFSFTLWIANLGVLSLPFLVTTELIITLPNVSWHEVTFAITFETFSTRSRDTFTSSVCVCRGCLRSSSWNIWKQSSLWSGWVGWCWYFPSTAWLADYLWSCSCPRRRRKAFPKSSKCLKSEDPLSCRHASHEVGFQLYACTEFGIDPIYCLIRIIVS